MSQHDTQKDDIRGAMINRGSEWHRREPHIHAPGTLFDDQYKGPNAWDDSFSSLEQATPVIRAIAVTDSYCADTYHHVVREMNENGRLAAGRARLPHCRATARRGGGERALDEHSPSRLP